MKFNKNKVKSYMKMYVEDCRDRVTGEVNHTLLAEVTASNHNLYGRNYSIPEEVFEIALNFN